MVDQYKIRIPELTEEQLTYLKKLPSIKFDPTKPCLKCGAPTGDHPFTGYSFYCDGVLIAKRAVKQFADDLKRIG